MPMDYAQVAEKWQKRWNEAHVYEPEPDARKGFYIQAAYPYPSGAMHIGHARTYTIADIVARYKRMQGFNALMPMGWHVSGTPVIASVELLKAKDQKTIDKMTKNFLIPEGDLKELETPHGFVNYFVNKAGTSYKAGFKKLGLGIDWRRELTTMDKQYNKFVEWQYRKLNKKGYLGKGRYPVRYCPHDKNPVGDHDLTEGEGLGISEMTLLKFKYKDMYVVAATLRPETVFGQTNLWVDADADYAVVEVISEKKSKKEKWVVSNECAEKLKHQMKSAKVAGRIAGKKLLGEFVRAPGINRKIPILPSYFCDPNVGTGIVTSVPSDAPHDWMGLRDLQTTDTEIEKFRLDRELVKSIKVIPIINTPKYGDTAAVKACEEMGITSQRDSAKLELAKEAVYKEGFFLGKMNKNCGKYAGMKVEAAKKLIKKALMAKGLAGSFYEMEGRAICRCGTQVVARVLDDQWFVRYSDRKWKKEALKTLHAMQTVPELYKSQYEKVFEWLEDKPCTRAKGLGTRFPWDKTKIIEPLGDSTIYMAYFTFSHLIKEVPAERLNDSVFDYVFLAKGKPEAIAKKRKIPVEKLKAMRRNFDYWYPLAYNASAVELIPNHMSFSIFQHTAIFPPEKRQLGTLNLGMLVIEGKKMASSKGNVVLIDSLSDKIGPDMVRFFLMNFNEPWQEVDWKPSEVEKGLRAMNSFIDWAERTCGRAKPAKELNPKALSGIDLWLYNRFNSRMNNYLEAMEGLQLRRALQEISFGLVQDLKWHERRCTGVERNEALYKYILDCWTRAMAPFTPHICEELWEKLGGKEFVVGQLLPKKQKVDESADASEELLRNAMSDIDAIKGLSGIGKPKRIVLYTVPEWKWGALNSVLKACEAKPDFGAAMRTAMAAKGAKENGKAVEAFVKTAMKRLSEYRNARRIDEFAVLKLAQGFLQKEFGCEIIIEAAETASFDPAKKAQNAMPLKPAIYIE